MRCFSLGYWYQCWLFLAPFVNNQIRVINARWTDNSSNIKDEINKNVSISDSVTLENQELIFVNLNTTINNKYNLSQLVAERMNNFYENQTLTSNLNQTNNGELLTISEQKDNYDYEKGSNRLKRETLQKINSIYSDSAGIFYIESSVVKKIDKFYDIPKIKNATTFLEIPTSSSDTFYFASKDGEVYYVNNWTATKINGIDKDDEIKEIIYLGDGTSVFFLSKSGYIYYIDKDWWTAVRIDRYFNLPEIKNVKSVVKLSLDEFYFFNTKNGIYFLTTNSWKTIKIKEIEGEIHQVFKKDKKYKTCFLDHDYYVLSNNGYFYYFHLEELVLHFECVLIWEKKIYNIIKIIKINDNKLIQFTNDFFSVIIDRSLTESWEEINIEEIKQLKIIEKHNRNIKYYFYILSESGYVYFVKIEDPKNSYLIKEQIQFLQLAQITFSYRKKIFQKSVITEKQQEYEQSQEVIVKKPWMGIRIDKKYNLPEIKNVKSMQVSDDVIYFNTANGVYFMTNEDWKLTQIKGMIAIPKLPYFKKFLMIDDWWFENLKRDFPDWNSDKIINLGLINDNNDNDIKNVVKKKYPNLKMNDIEFIKDYSYFQENVKTNINFNPMLKYYPQFAQHIQNSTSFGGFSAKINVKDSSNDYSFGILKPKFTYVTQTKITEISNKILSDSNVKQWIVHINDYNRKLPVLKEQLNNSLRKLQSVFSSEGKEEINQAINAEIQSFRYKEQEVFKRYLRDWNYVIALIEINFKIDELNPSIEGLKASFDLIKDQINKLDSSVSDLNERVGTIENQSNVDCANLTWVASSLGASSSVATKTTKIMNSIPASFKVVVEKIPVVGDVVSAVGVLTASFCGLFGN